MSGPWMRTAIVTPASTIRVPICAISSWPVKSWACTSIPYTMSPTISASWRKSGRPSTTGPWWTSRSPSSNIDLTSVSPKGGYLMSTHGIQRDPCCVFPADGKTATKDLFELKPVADGVYAAIAAPQYKVNSNAAVILTNDGAVVVDSHSKPSAARTLYHEIRDLTKYPVH